MEDQFSRTRMLLGSDRMEKLKKAHVALFGVGGVGGYAAEALARAGIGHIDLIDNDTVSLSNINRQIVATHATVGRLKTDVMKERILEINPEAVVTTYSIFFTPETENLFDFGSYDYVIDAIDTVTGKIGLVMAAAAAGVPIISSMGAGNKLDPAAFEVTDIYKTSVCPLARVMRTELKKRGIRKLKVVYSKEPPRKVAEAEDEPAPPGRRQVPGSISFVPSVAGLILAGEVIRDIAGAKDAQTALKEAKDS